MREIKFRAWDRANNEMYDVKMLQWERHRDKLASHEYDEIMQFTGLYDKNNKDIFEGDIVQFKNMVRQNIGIIEFGEGFFGIKYIQSKFKDEWDKTVSWMGLCLLNRFDCESNIEIIGNIYENHELLNNANEVQMTKGSSSR